MGDILRGNMVVRRVRRLEIKARETKAGVGDTSALAMVALFVPPEVTDRLYIPGGETPEGMHVTLAFLGEIEKIKNVEEAVRRAVQDLARQYPPLRGVINGIGRFIQTHKDGMHAVYASPDLPGLPELRQALVARLAEVGCPQQSEHGFVPHITLNYVDKDEPTPAVLDEPVPVEFTALSIEWGNVRTDYPLTAGEATPDPA